MRPLRTTKETEILEDSRAEGAQRVFDRDGNFIFIGAASRSKRDGKHPTVAPASSISVSLVVLRSYVSGLRRSPTASAALSPGDDEPACCAAVWG